MCSSLSLNICVCIGVKNFHIVSLERQRLGIFHLVGTNAAIDAPIRYLHLSLQLFQKFLYVPFQMICICYCCSDHVPSSTVRDPLLQNRYNNAGVCLLIYFQFFQSSVMCFYFDLQSSYLFYLSVVPYILDIHNCIMCARLIKVGFA